MTNNAPFHTNQSTDEDTRLQLIHSIPALVWSADAHGAIEFLNQRWTEYTGLRLSEIQGRLWIDANFIHPEDVPGLMERWHAIASHGQAGEAEARMKRFDGEYHWFLVRVAPLYDESGRVVQWYGTNTALRETEEQIRRSEEQYRQIVEAIPQFISVVAHDGTFLYSNELVCDYTGLTDEDFRTTDFRARIYHPRDMERTFEQRQQGLLRGLPFQIEQRVKRKDGQYRWFLTHYNPSFNEEGQILRWYITSVDIDERKRAEERVKEENIALREEINKIALFEEIVGNSEVLRQVLLRVERVAPTDSTVLITGETGTGKELIARAIHKRSQRAERAFISVNCAAIPQSLIASELFGHEKGAFTGALQRRMGRFELADGGTLFLDEIGELPVETQIALLRVLQEREFERVGGTHSIKIDVRVVAATNRDLQALIESGKFRSDLFYRLNVFPIEVPPLRERKEDVGMLVKYFIDRYSRQMGKKIRSIDKKTLTLLESYSWPGNIRELQNVIERSMIICETQNFLVDERWVSRESVASVPTVGKLSQHMIEHEKEMIEAALDETKGRVSGTGGAAAKLGIPTSTLETKIKALKIDKYRFKTGR